MKKLLINITLWTWCLPQSLWGFIVFIILKKKGLFIDSKEYKYLTLVKVKNIKAMYGVSLGKYIFLCEASFNDKNLMHEYGHTIQNYFLGPLYLLIVGFPSQILLLRYHYQKCFTGKDYFKHFPENWADKLGGVDRK